MNTLSMISAAAMVATVLATLVWAGPVGMGRTAPAAQSSPGQTQVNSELIARLQEASEEAAQEGRHGGTKNSTNPVFLKKSAQINDLIERLKRRQTVDPAQIDQAFEPVRFW